MALFKGSKEESKPVGNFPCFTGFICCQDVTIWPNTTSSKLVAYKTFHCFRRYQPFNKLKECDACLKDVNRDCFKLVKPYLGRLDPDILVKVYARKVKSPLDNGVIFWDNPYFKAIVDSLKLAENVAPVKDITVSKDEYEEEVPF